MGVRFGVQNELKNPALRSARPSLHCGPGLAAASHLRPGPSPFPTFADHSGAAPAPHPGHSPVNTAATTMAAANAIPTIIVTPAQHHSR